LGCPANWKELRQKRERGLGCLAGEKINTGYCLKKKRQKKKGQKKGLTAKKRIRQKEAQAQK